MTLLTIDDLPCKELVELITDYLEGALPASLVERFESHLASCPYCAEYLEQIRRTIVLTGRLRETDFDAAARDRLLEAFRTWHHPTG